MKVHIHFYQINQKYSQEYADEQHDGAESPDNMKFWWEDAIATKNDIFKISEPISGDFQLTAFINDEEKNFTIPNVLKFQLLNEQNQMTEIVVSKSLIDHYEVTNIDENETKIEFYLKDNTVFSRPVPGQYFEIDDFPKELKV